jgi:outer membrane receptor protein involved in Fe transport
MNKIGLLMLCFALLTINLFSQTSGKIIGTVTDATTGEPLGYVNVTVEETYLGAATDEDGQFFILNVPPGEYEIRFMIIGYTIKIVEGVRVSVNRTTPINISLEESVVTGEETKVSAERISVKKDQTMSIRNVSSDEMQALPVESVNSVVALQPGVVSGHFRGGRSNETAYMIDGVSVNNGLNRGQMVTLDPDAVQEVEVITGTFSAKYGEAMSGVVNMVTKDGENNFHGKLEGYLGNYLTSHTDQFEGIKASDVDRNVDVRFILNGPVVKDNLTFFVSGRVQDNDNHLNGIRRFNIYQENQPDYSQYQNPNLFMFDPVTGDSSYLLGFHEGDNEYVPMNWYQEFNINGKLSYNLKTLKMSLMYLMNDSENQGYNHSQKYKPDGRSTNYNDSYMLTYTLNQLIGSKVFYELKIAYANSQYGRYLYEDPLDPHYIHDRFSANTSYTGFVTGGQDKDYVKSITDKFTVRLDATWQINMNHSLESGFEGTQYKYDYRYHSIQNAYRNTAVSGILYAPQVEGNNTVYTDEFVKKPQQISGWISDKMEFESMVVDLGLRGEYFNPETYYPSNYQNPNNLLQKEDTPEWISTYPRTDPKFNLAPRLGLSYQLGKKAILRFSYGHFYQYPPYSTMYQNHAYVLDPSPYASTLGNPTVNPEKTVSYEVGLWQALNDYMDLEVALWYKDIYFLSTVNIVTTYNQVRYGLYGNKDYGNARGLELKYKTRVGSFGGEVNYTLQYTRGNADNPIYTFTRAGNSQDPIPTLIAMSWDQRHTLNFSLYYAKEKYTVSLLGWLGSGTAYTWSPIDQNPVNRVNLYDNNSHKPFHFTTDLLFYYDFARVWGSNLRVTLRVYNLFDRLNENGVNSNTGRTNQAIIRPQDRLGYWSDFSTYEESIYNPAAWSTPRLVKLGLGIFF